MPFKATASRFMGRISYQGRAWSMEFPEEELDKWIAFFEGMVEKYGHRTPNYAISLAALRGLTDGG